MSYQPLDRPAKIQLMNPRNKLAAASHFPAETQSNQTAQHWKHTVPGSALYIRSVA
ncbi:MAG TPA: hypothetical protein VNX28_11865 [Gemmataceae bacterium]|nr:hypothetical protein [Gemmataceae bacterium]